MLITRVECAARSVELSRRYEGRVVVCIAARATCLEEVVRLGYLKCEQPLGGCMLMPTVRSTCVSGGWHPRTACQPGMRPRCEVCISISEGHCAWMAIDALEEHRWTAHHQRVLRMHRRVPNAHMVDDAPQRTTKDAGARRGGEQFHLGARSALRALWVVVTNARDGAWIVRLRKRHGKEQIGVQVDAALCCENAEAEDISAEGGW